MRRANSPREPSLNTPDRIQRSNATFTAHSPEKLSAVSISLLLYARSGFAFIFLCNNSHSDPFPNHDLSQVPPLSNTKIAPGEFHQGLVFLSFSVLALMGIHFNLPKRPALKGEIARKITLLCRVLISTTQKPLPVLSNVLLSTDDVTHS